VLAIVILACYLSAAAWLIASVYRATPEQAHGRRVAGLGTSFVALLTHAIALWQSLATQSAALSLAETASLVGFILAFVAWIACLRQPRFAGTSAVFLVIAGLVGAATDKGAQAFVASQHGWELNAHIALSVLAYAFVTVGAAFAIAMTLLDQRLRRRKALGWLSILPSLEALESALFQAIGAGFATLSLALFSGFFFIQNLREQHLTHKVILSCLAWVILGILLLGRWRFGWRGRTALYWTLGGFVVLGLAYFGNKLVLETFLGRHWG
jgi:ABC-type uncharacterized transport system permease subunit